MLSYIIPANTSTFSKWEGLPQRGGGLFKFCGQEFEKKKEEKKTRELSNFQQSTSETTKNLILRNKPMFIPLYPTLLTITMAALPLTIAETCSKIKLN